MNQLDRRRQAADCMRGTLADVMRIRRQVLGKGWRVTKAGRELEWIERRIRRWIDKHDALYKQKRRAEEGNPRRGATAAGAREGARPRLPQCAAAQEVAQHDG